MPPDLETTRRGLMVAGVAVTLAASTGAQAETAPAAPAPARAPPAKPADAATISGTVREDISRTGGHGITDLPIPDVLISNGRDIVRTDAMGRYTLPIAPGMTIFLIKPSGFAVPTDLTTHLPLFAYVYEPEGTPDALGLRYPGLRPTGPLPAYIDFALIRTKELERFEVVLLTDPQPESTAEMEYVRDDIVAGLVGSTAAFGITAGDLLFDDLSMYGRFNRIVGRIGLPWWSVGGNHDLNFEAPDARRSRESFKRVFGATYYAHEYAGALFVMLDNVDYLGADPANPGRSGKYRGFISADQLRFVANLLKETPAERLIVLVMHIPLTTYLDTKNPAMNTVNAADLLGLLGDRPSVSFSGHTHSTEHHYLGQAEGFPGAIPHHHHVLTAASGSWWSGPLDHRGIACADSYDGTPNGFHILTIDGANYTTRFVPSGGNGGQMRITVESQAHGDDREVMHAVPMSQLLRSPITADQTAGALLVVNVFDGGPKTLVSCAIDNVLPLAMARVSRPDPFVTQVYGRYPTTIKPWVKPQHSSHIWTAKLPPLRFGTYAIRVRALDEYGREHTDSLVLEVI